MSAEIINIYAESHPNQRLIGKRYTDGDRNEFGMFSHKWGEWFAGGLFEKLAAHATPDAANGDSYIGLCGSKPNGAEGEFEYWIGMFFPEGTPPLDGFDYADIPAAEVGVCWVKGTEPDIYMQSLSCYAELAGEGMTVPHSETAMAGRWWEFERYNCPRFTEPDADGNVILDICVYLKA